MSLTESSHSPAKNRTKIVMTFGTFDLFHPGHRYYLSESGKLADSLIVVIARDHRVFSGKGKNPIHDEVSRYNSVGANFPNALVILGDESDIFAPIRKHTPDILAFGYDQKVPEDKIKELFPSVEIVRI